MNSDRNSLVIQPRFNGPPGCGNGGYVCGMLAGRVQGPAQVTLRRPIPLNRELRVGPSEHGGQCLLDGDTLLAEALSADPDIVVPEPPTPEQAEAAATRYQGFREHAFPACFVCGPERRPDDGMRLFAGPVEGRDMVATPWVPAGFTSDRDDYVAEEFVWAALDCPGAFAVTRDGLKTPIVLGRLTARLDGPVRVGERYVVMAWSMGGEGRKRLAGSAVLDGQGRVLAAAQAVWILLEQVPR